MSQENELPPWLKEQISRLQQLQQNLQAIMMQKQQIELEIVETERALEELSKTTTKVVVFQRYRSMYFNTPPTYSMPRASFHKV